MLATERVSFTAGVVERHTCETGQSFLWDKGAPGLGVRATAGGAKAFIFQSRFQGKTLRMTIGSPGVWKIPDARKRARELQATIDQGRDPRVVQAEAAAADVAKREAKRNAVATVADAWAAYLEDRRPRWGELHYADHIRLSRAGGEKRKRGKTRTVSGPLHSLMPEKLANLSAEVIEAWSKREAAKRPTTARLAWRLLKAFLAWGAEQRAYANLLPAHNPAKTKKSRETFGAPSARKDVLQREQLAPWFAAVSAIPNRPVSVYLRALLLTGARPGELLALRWEDVSPQWKAIAIHDKVEGERMIPLTPYVAHMFASLPRANEWVFATVQPVVERIRPGRAEMNARAANKRKDSRIAVPQKPHARACAAVGIEGLTLHGLRRSFSSLTEWLEIPSGVVAQIMGHKPSATAEKHYKVRPLDLLRVHHEKIEAWILEQAGIEFDAKAAEGGLRAVA